MNCPACGLDNREGRRFCAGCGAALALACSSCGASNEPGERFCGQCGTALATPAQTTVPTNVEQRRGRVVKTDGDGFMAAFPSPADAIASALHVQRAVTSASFAEPIRMRIDVHVGSPVREGGDFFGVDVTLAHRITSLASGGEILVSTAVRELVASTIEASTFSTRREVNIKGLSGTHGVHAVSWYNQNA